VDHLFIAGQINNTATANALGLCRFSMQLVFTDIGPISIIAFAAMLVAEETGTGTIRAALAAPVQRWELYLAKAVIGLFYMMVLSATALLFSAALASHPLPLRRGGRFPGSWFMAEIRRCNSSCWLRAQLDSAGCARDVSASSSPPWFAIRV